MNRKRFRFAWFVDVRLVVGHRVLLSRGGSLQFIFAGSEEELDRWVEDLRGDVLREGTAAYPKLDPRKFMIETDLTLRKLDA